MPKPPHPILLVLLAALTGPAARAQVSIEPDQVVAAIDLATLLDSRQRQPRPPGEAWFELLRGSQPVIVTAPHATRPFRMGRFRFADGGGTGALARALHDTCGVTVLYTVWDSPSDPNFDDDNEFKARLGELIAELGPVLVLDIHGSNAFRPYDIDLGTMHGQSVAADPTIVPQLTAALRGAGLSNLSDNRFPAAVNRTITRYAHTRGVPAVQLEFSVTRTSPQDGPLAGHLFAQALEALARFLDGRGRCTRPTVTAAEP